MLVVLSSGEKEEGKGGAPYIGLQERLVGGMAKIISLAKAIEFD
jgi:hypothetical protein